jgi:hypothetical protein
MTALSDPTIERATSAQATPMRRDLGDDSSGLARAARARPRLPPAAGAPA